MIRSYCLLIILLFIATKSFCHGQQIDNGKAFIEKKLEAWRKFDSKQRWFGCLVDSGAGNLTETRFVPGFYHSVSTDRKGSSNVVFSNDRYSAVITKSDSSSPFEIFSLGNPYDVSAFNRRSFSHLSYLMDGQYYIPDLIKQQEINVSAFETDRDQSWIWFEFDDERKSSLKLVGLKGDFALKFDSTSPRPIGAIFRFQGRSPEVHRMVATEFQEIDGERLPSRFTYEIEYFDASGKLTNSRKVPSTSRRYSNEPSLDPSHCYLEHYGLPEIGFVQKPRSNTFLYLTVSSIALMILGILIVRVRRRR